MTVRIRKIEERDEPVEELTRHVWGRIQDFASPIHAIVAEREGEGVIGAR